ncbi:MAG: hydrolase [Methylococcales bacterium]|nr:hydrolase [Methylococcales bacterium]
MITAAFKPAWWLNNPHLQTLYPTLFRQIRTHPLVRRERLITPDNDFLDLDWCVQGQQPLVILLHGLSGSSKSGYISGLQHALLDEGFNSVTLNFRGCSGESNRLARCYHSGETEDIHFVYQTLRQRYPKTPLAVIGFSIGGNVLLKWLGEQQTTLQLFAAVAVSVPLVLSTCATQMDQGFSKIYREYLLRELKDYIGNKRSALEKQGCYQEAEKLKQLGDLSPIHSFWHYDNQVVASLHGFKDAHHYYESSSSRQFIKQIKHPTLIIQALDDPFMNPSVIPSADELSESVCLEVTTGGGHVGFITGDNPLKPCYWLEQRIPVFLNQHL